MANRKLLIWPDPVLSRVSVPVPKVDQSVRDLVQDLIDTMNYEGDAAGLAAAQIGVSLRVFVADIPPEDNDGNGTKGQEAFINPEFLLKEGEQTNNEACLSLPGEHGQVTRARRVIMRYLDINGDQKEIEGYDYLALCLQHETDHLDGKLWIDYQSRLKRDLVRKKMAKLKQR